MKGKNLTDQFGSAKSMVMQPLFKSRTEVDRKKKNNSIRGQKHKKSDY